MKHHITFISAIILLLAVNTSQANEFDVDSLRTQQKQLQSLLNDIEKASQQRKQHNLQIKRLKHQLECNWMLVRSYETCGKLHANNPQEHLDCSTIAKRAAATCLNSTPAE